MKVQCCAVTGYQLPDTSLLEMHYRVASNLFRGNTKQVICLPGNRQLVTGNSLFDQELST